MALTIEMDARTLYEVLALRSAIFVVEQDCVYLDLDGRDLEPDAQQLWIDDGGVVVATLRLLRDDASTARIGRVATTPTHRGRGLAALLMRRALQLAETQTIALNAQTYLAAWYARFGFVPSGPEYLEDGIPHVPMILRR